MSDFLYLSIKFFFNFIVMSKIYLDNAATTPMAEEVITEMVKVMKENYGNPSSIHSVGQEAKTLIEQERRKIADFLSVQPNEIVFTSCGTESNNFIIKSSVNYLGVERIITSPMEHKCVAESVQDVKKTRGVEVVYLRPNEKGDISLEKLEEVLQSSSKKTLVSLMHANNEIGNIYDIESIGNLCQKYGAYFHSDTVQTLGHLPLDFSKLPLHFASCSAHKFHGPKGIGFAYVNKDTKLKPLISGGGQERDCRSGTENVTGIVGMGKAMEVMMQSIDEKIEKVQKIKDFTIELLKERVKGVRFNGRSDEKDKSLYTVLSVLLPFKDPLIGFKLDMKGIAISQGSACSSGAGKPSAVMMMILNDDDLENTTPLRVSFSHYTTEEEIKEFVLVLEEISKTFD